MDEITYEITGYENNCLVVKYTLRGCSLVIYLAWDGNNDIASFIQSHAPITELLLKVNPVDLSSLIGQKGSFPWSRQ